MYLFGTRQLADSMRAVRQNTVLIAEDIPESKYHYRRLRRAARSRNSRLHRVVIDG